MAMNESGQDLIMKNSLEMLNFVRNLYYHQQKKTSAKKSLTSPLAQQEPKKKSINDNKEFFRQMSIRILVMVVMKLTTIEVTDLHFEIVQVNAKDYQPKPMFKLQVTKYNMYFEYQKTDHFLMNNHLKDAYVYIRNNKEHTLDLITTIEDINVRLYLPLTLRLQNSIVKSRMETKLESLDVHLKDEHLLSLIQLYVT